MGSQGDEKSVLDDGFTCIGSRLYIFRIMFEVEFNLVQRSNNHERAQILHTGSNLEANPDEIRHIALRTSRKFLVDGGNSVSVGSRRGISSAVLAG